MSVCGGSESGKTNLILNFLTKPSTTGGIFSPPYKKIVYFYRHWQPIYDSFLQKIEAKLFFRQLLAASNQRSDGVNKTPDVPVKRLKTSKANQTSTEIEEALNNLLNHQKEESGFRTSGENDKVLAIFDDSCEKLIQSFHFSNLATAGRHRGVSVIFVKHNLYQQGKYCVTTDKNTTHFVILKTPIIGKQLKILGSEIEYGGPTFLLDVYRKATVRPFGHLLIDLTTNCTDALRFSTNSFDQSVFCRDFVFSKFENSESQSRQTPMRNRKQSTNELVTSLASSQHQSAVYFVPYDIQNQYLYSADDQPVLKRSAVPDPFNNGDCKIHLVLSQHFDEMRRINSTLTHTVDQLEYS